MESNNTVAAIDFGTTYSGYAYCTKKDLESKTPNIKTNQPWKTGGMDVQFLKTPTTILFDPDGKFYAFGFEAENKYAKLAVRKMHEKWFYFRHFKMTLFRIMKYGQPRELNRDTKIHDETGHKSMKVMEIFSHSINYLKDHLLSVLSDRGSELAGHENAADNIKWILTVPAIWDEAAKQFMREAAVEAGIKNEHLRLALEPEAASICCQFLQNENPDNYSLLLPPKTKYMILDLGGGTADITSHEVLSDRSLKEIHAPIGGYWGGTKVDLAFEDLIISLVGAPLWLKFQREHFVDYLHLKRNFESLKQTATFEKEEEQMIQIPSTLVQMFEKSTEENLIDVIIQSSFKDRIEFTTDNWMIFHADTFRDLFSPSIQPLLSQLYELFSKDRMTRVDTIVMVGGFSESSLVKGLLKKNFANKRFIFPDKPSLAILKGAVIFGHCPEKISARVAKLTYGFSAVRKFHEGDLVEYKSGNDCLNTFDKIVEIGTTVTVGSITAERTYGKVHSLQSSMCLMLYSSTDRDPKYITETTCSLVGDLAVELPVDADNGVLVKIVYGDTELIVHATELLSKKSVTAKFDFLK